MRAFLLSALFFSMVISFSTSCKKEGPASAVITITDTLGRTISGATVTLRQDSVTNPVNGVQASVNQQQSTDQFGQAYFSFDLESVLIVEAEKGTMSARDFIRLEQSKTVSKTLVIR
jgi:hypothetical protein